MINERTFTIAAVVLCAGNGKRSGLSYNKILYRVGSKTVLENSLDRFVGIADRIVCVCSAVDREAVLSLTSGYENLTVVLGGATRTDSVRNALSVLENVDVVAIHDGARPFVTEEIIIRAVESAYAFGSGISALPVVDAIKASSGDTVHSLDKSTLKAAQTPQAFCLTEIKDAYNRISGSYADDCEVYERAGYSPRLTEGDYSNIKITTPEDLFRLTGDTRVGIGYDVHRMETGRRLILGGVLIPYEKGLLGHSDADALVHAVMDALLSAAGLPDIGVLFPDTDAAYEGADSIKLLDKVMAKVTNGGFRVQCVSAVVMAQRPKLAPYIGQMRKNIAEHCRVGISAVNISATTTEELGIIGEGKGIASSAFCLLVR